MMIENAYTRSTQHEIIVVESQRINTMWVNITKIKELMQEQEKTRNDLSTLSGIPYYSLANVFKRWTCSMGTASRIAYALGVTIKDIEGTLKPEQERTLKKLQKNEEILQELSLKAYVHGHDEEYVNRLEAQAILNSVGLGMALSKIDLLSQSMINPADLEPVIAEIVLEAIKVGKTHDAMMEETAYIKVEVQHEKAQKSTTYKDSKGSTTVKTETEYDIFTAYRMSTASEELDLGLQWFSGDTSAIEIR